MYRVLIIEDDLMIADMVQEVLQEQNFLICGIARDPCTALRIAEQTSPELAVVDVFLYDGLGTEVAPILMTRFNTGILYTTANIASLVGAAGHACLPKPFSLFEIGHALTLVAEIIRTGTAQPPYPKRFMFLRSGQLVI